MYVSRAADAVILRNRIYGISTSGTSSSSSVAGIYNADSLNATFLHNQVSVGAGTTGLANVYGVLDVASTGTNKFYYNTIFVNGAGTGNVNSYCLMRSQNDGIGLLNNIFYNKRSSGG